MTLKKVGGQGSVTITRNERDGIYYLRYWNPATKRMKSISTRIRAQTERQKHRDAIPAAVEAQAKALNLSLGSGVAKHLVADANPGIEQAMNAAIDNSRAQTEGRRADLIRFSGYFLEFMGERFPQVRYWADVRPSHVQAYIESHHARGVAPKSMKHYCNIVSMTSRYWTRENPDVFRLLEIVSKRLVSRKKPSKHYLDSKQLRFLADLAFDLDRPLALAGIMFGGYTGMNLMEIVRLNSRSFDLKAGTVCITESKNQFRERTLPMLSRVRNYVDALLERHGSHWGLYKADGSPATHLTVGRALRRVLDHAHKMTGDEAFSRVDPKDMRKSFANLCVVANVPESATGAFLGHRPASMTAQVYADYGQEGYLRQEVVERVESYLDKQERGAAIVAINA